MGKRVNWAGINVYPLNEYDPDTDRYRWWYYARCVPCGLVSDLFPTRGRLEFSLGRHASGPGHLAAIGGD